MKAEKPVVDLNDMIDWIRCPMKTVWKAKNRKPVYDYESLLRTMILNTLKAACRDAGPDGRPRLDVHAADIWEYLLTVYNFPDPGKMLGKMNEFYGLRCSSLEKMGLRYQDTDGTLNTEHWWDAGLCFNREYFRLRNEINEFQALLGFPDWNLVRAFYREEEYRPVTLADAFCDCMNAVKVFKLLHVPQGLSDRCP